MARILVIEDSEDVRQMNSFVLKTYGHEVLSISEKINVNWIISNFTPQVVLLDAWTSYKSRAEICKELKTADTALPIILMLEDEKLLSDIEACDADDIISKPFDIMELKDKIDKVLT